MLYISPDFNNPASGGEHINKRNYDALKSILHDKLVTYMLFDYSPQVVLLRNRFLRIIYLFFSSLNGYVFGYSIKDKKEILKILREKSINTVFISSSKYGRLVEQIKKHNSKIKIIVFFHNIESQYSTEEFRVNRNLFNLFWMYVVSKYEKISCKYADYLVLLNERDEQLLEKRYCRRSSLLLPTTFVDRYYDKPNDNIVEKSNSQLNLLFVGVNFFANTEGIGWFIDNVMTKVENLKLTIVGKGMDKIFMRSSSVDVYGYVKDISIFYLKADAVILPIFSGGGMKTKTAEALMYGMPIIGTTEAFTGYNFDYNRVGICTNSAEQMITFLNDLNSDRHLLVEYSRNSRELFLSHHSFESSIIRLKHFIECNLNSE